MIGAKLICEGKWGVGCEKNSPFTQSLRELEKSALNRQPALSCTDFSAQPTNLTQNANFSNVLDSVSALNADMPKGGENQGVDSTQGAGVWNMEQNDPDFFMAELNKQGLPYVVVEFDSSGEPKIIEDGRK